MSLFGKTKALAKNRLTKFRKYKTKTKVLIVLIALVIIAAGYNCFQTIKGPGVVSAYEDVPVIRGDISEVIEGTAAIEPVEQYNVIALVSGEVLSSPFKEGDKVEKGDILYQIDSADVSSSVEKASLGLEQAKLDYNNTMNDVKNLKVKTPVGGEIISFEVSLGDQVSAGQVIAKVINDDALILTVPFNTVSADSISVGDDATVFLEDFLQTIPGKVIHISSGTSVEAGGATVKEIKIKITNPGALTTYNTASATVKGMQSYVSGKFSYGTEQDIVAKASGEVGRINFEQGDRIAANEVVIEMDSEMVDLELQTKSLALRNAELYLQDAYAVLENYTITAPISGTVISKTVNAGDTLDNMNNSITMAVIADMSKLMFKMNVDELDITKLTVGQEVDITAEALPGRQFSGQVENISIMGSTNNGVTTYPVTVAVSQDESSSLLPGMNVTARIVVKSSKNALLVPISAVFDGNYVLVPDSSGDGNMASGSEDGTTGTGLPVITPPAGYKYVPVKVGINDNNNIEITSGLKEGDIVAEPVSIGQPGLPGAAGSDEMAVKE